MTSLKSVAENSAIAAAGLLALFLNLQPVYARDADTGIRVIAGEVLQFDVGGYLIKDLYGRKVHIEVSEQTQMAPTPLVGDRVEATIAANGIAISIKKLNSPRHESASRASPRVGESSTDQSEGDQNLRYRIEKRLRTDDRIDWEVLDVAVQDGQATLYGEVRTLEEKGYAASIASTVPGIKGLTNSILVEPALSPDHKLTKAIWHALRTVPVLQDNDTLRVSVNNAVAKLRGNVENSLQKKAAEDAAASVPGVTKVVSQIRVKPDTTGLKDKGTEKMRKEGVEAMP